MYYIIFRERGSTDRPNPIASSQVQSTKLIISGNKINNEKEKGKTGFHFFLGKGGGLRDTVETDKNVAILY